jgi:hypothetical protein
VPGREREAHAADQPIVLAPRQPDALRAEAVSAFAQKRRATLPASELVARLERDDRPFLGVETNVVLKL